MGACLACDRLHKFGVALCAFLLKTARLEVFDRILKMKPIARNFRALQGALLAVLMLAACSQKEDEASVLQRAMELEERELGGKLDAFLAKYDRNDVDTAGYRKSVATSDEETID